MSKTYRHKISKFADSDSFDTAHPKMRKQLKEEKRQERSRREEKRIFFKSSKETT